MIQEYIQKEYKQLPVYKDVEYMVDEKTKNIPVIVITAKAQAIDRVLGLHIAHVDDYISKPFRPQELLESIEKVLTKIEDKNT